MENAKDEFVSRCGQAVIKAYENGIDNGLEELYKIENKYELYAKDDGAIIDFKKAIIDHKILFIGAPGTSLNYINKLKEEVKESGFISDSEKRKFLNEVNAIWKRLGRL